MDILTKQVDRGFDATKRDASELPRGSAADGSQNCLYSRGTIKTPYGFSKVESGSLPLDSGNAVLLTGIFSELDKTQHFLACTKDKIYRRDIENSQWDDKTQSGVALQGNIYNPMSIASVLHTDGLALNGSGDSWYHHCLVCTGVSPVQRWAGKFETDFADLVGADGYHAVGSGYTTHYALQVGVFNERAILISAKEADANGNLVDCNQKIRWPMAGKLETWTGTGSGSTKLLETGGYNIWGAQLGNQWIQYQNNSIWSLTHVGGTRVYETDIEMPDLGLLAAHLLYSKNNVHYFVGNDFNIYAYYGGSNIKNIGRKIQRYLQRDLDPEYAYRSWICMGAENSRLWIFIVPNGETYVTEGYGIDMQTGSWMKRDFKHKWPTGGITSVSLVGASSYYAGLSYREAVALTTTYSAAIDAGTTYRQALQETLTTERIVFGDSAGYVFQYDDTVSKDDNVNIPSRHITDVYDLGVPGKNKLWPGIRVTAKGTGIGTGGMIVSYRTGNFETTDTGWIAFAEQALTSEFVTYKFTVWDTARKIQFKFENLVNLLDNPDFEADLDGWNKRNGDGTVSIESISDDHYGDSAKVARCAGGSRYWAEADEYIEIDNTKTYYGEIWVRQTSDPTNEQSNMYAGIINYDSDKVETTAGGRLNSRSHFIAEGKEILVADGWQLFTGHITGTGTSNPTFATDTVYVRFQWLVNNAVGDGTAEVAFIRLAEAYNDFQISNYELIEPMVQG